MYRLIYCHHSLIYIIHLYLTNLYQSYRNFYLTDPKFWIYFLLKVTKQPHLLCQIHHFSKDTIQDHLYLRKNPSEKKKKITETSKIKQCGVPLTKNHVSHCDSRISIFLHKIFICLYLLCLCLYCEAIHTNWFNISSSVFEDI